MKFVETEVPGGEDDAEETPETPIPPRPERRQVYVSLALTFSVLVGTVVAVYTIFPKRDHEVLRIAIDAHQRPGDFALERPTPRELMAWTIGLLGRGVSWPEAGEDLEVLGVRALTIHLRDAAMVRLRAGDQEVTLVATPAREPLPRTFRLSASGLKAVSWRAGKFTMIAVGPEETIDHWGPAVGAR
jgi:hypothetical protein